MNLFYVSEKFMNYDFFNLFNLYIEERFIISVFFILYIENFIYFEKQILY